MTAWVDHVILVDWGTNSFCFVAPVIFVIFNILLLPLEVFFVSFLHVWVSAAAVIVMPSLTIISSLIARSSTGILLRMTPWYSGRIIQFFLTSSIKKAPAIDSCLSTWTNSTKQKSLWEVFHFLDLNLNWCLYLPFPTIVLNLRNVVQNSTCTSVHSNTKGFLKSTAPVFIFWLYSNANLHLFSHL